LVRGHRDHQIEVARAELEHAGVIIADDFEDDAVEIRLALLPVVRVACQHHLDALVPSLQHEGAGPKRVFAGRIAPLLEIGLGEDARREGGKRGKKRCKRLGHL
jgi:hypothetical protein